MRFTLQTFWRFLSIILILTSCEEQRVTSKIEFLYFFDEPTYDNSPGAVREISFSFYRLDYNNPSDTSYYDIKSLHITIAKTDSVFSLKQDSIHNFHHALKDKNGKIIKEKIEDGQISGVLISKDVWQISAKTKYFDFVKCIPTNKEKKKFPYRETFFSGWL